MEPRDGDARKKRKGTPAPPARKRRKRTGAAAPPSLAPPPSDRMCPGDGDAPNAKRRRKPIGAAAPPSLAPPPSIRMGPGIGEDAPNARRRRKPIGATAPPSLAPLPSVRMARGDGGAPTERRRRKPTGAAAPSLAPPSSVRMAHGDGGAPPARKRKGSSPRREGKRGRRTDSEGSSSRNGSTGGRGGTESLHDDGTESSAGEEDSREGLAGCDDPNGSGAGGAGHTAHRSPDDPAPPSALPENVVIRGKISVAHTPNIPPRFEGLLKNITSLIPYASKGKSYECGLNQMNNFLKWSNSETAFFFEWSDEKMEMICWMHNIQKGEFFKFTMNAAFSHKMDNIIVERAAVAFSSNFIGNDDEYWSDLKDMLLNMFGSFEDDGLKDYDYLYVFTRVGDSIYLRNFKIISLPKASDPSSRLVLTEINTRFCLKLVNDQGTPKSSDIGPHLTKNETHTNLSLCLVTLYSNSNGQTGSCLSHDADFSGTIYSFFLENGSYVSSLEKLDGFNTSLAEIVVKEPLLKVKHIIGSVTNKTYCFARERCKSILQSLFAEVAVLLESGKCISETGQIFMHNVLVRGTTVRLYGVDLTDYTEHLATKTVKVLVYMVRNCFLPGTIPLDLFDLLQDLEKNPLDGIRIAKDDCSLLKAEDRRTLLININSEYMTNVEEKPSEPNHINEITFFEDCPYAKEWNEIMKDNEYMVQVCNVKSSDQENESDEDKDASVMQRMEKKVRVGKNTASIKKFAKKKKLETNNGKLQFSSKRNFCMHMPEKARKDGIIPFRLGMADHILTAYFPRFLRFVQKRMRDVKAQRGILKKRKRPSYVVRGQRQ